MQPVLQRQQAFSVAGLTVRTTNREEDVPQTARIGTLWDRFFDERTYDKTPYRTRDMRLYGVYSGYESHARGAFDITTGVAVSQGRSTVKIETGDYLVFTSQGEMPQMVLETWQVIWQYFGEHLETKRAYRSDFEAYSSPDQVAIHIGVMLK